MTTPNFPDLVPSSRQLSMGDWPTKTFRAMNGAEVRLLYGNKRTGFKLQLGFDNIPDAKADLIFQHYLACWGTFGTFSLHVGSRPDSSVKAGYQGDTRVFGADAWDNAYRYESEPTLTSVRPGVSSVSVVLLAVL